ncbi:sensor histidine kinase [Draconibacterium sp.]
MKLIVEKKSNFSSINFSTKNIKISYLWIIFIPSSELKKSNLSMGNISKSKLITLFIIAFIVFFGYVITNAQTFTSKTFTTDNGLSHNFVQQITQDKTGFLWISTWDGLNRYDGYEFKNYFHKPNDSTTVPFFVVDKTVVDASNNVWVMCQQRPAVIYNRNTDCFERFKPAEIRELVISDITLGPDSTVWIFSNNNKKLYHFDIENRLLSAFQFLDENGNPKIFENYPQLLIDNKDGIWLISIENNKYEVFRGEIFDASTVKLLSMKSLPIRIDTLYSDYKTQVVYDMNINENGIIFLFSKFGLFSYDTAAGRFVENFNTAIPDQISGNPYYFWSDKKTGIHIFDTKEKEVFSINPQPKKFIENVFVDSQKTVWVADSTNSHENIGLTRYMKTMSYFKYYLTNVIEPATTNILSSTSKIKNQEKWIAMRGLENILTIKPNGSFEKLSIPLVNGKLPRIFSMAKDSFGIWLGCTDNCLIRYDFTQNIFTTTVLNPDDEKGKVNLRMHNILLDKEDLIINGHEGIYKYNPFNMKLSMVYKHAPYNSCFCMISDENNGYWIGVSNNTIKHLDDNYKEISSYRIDEGFNNVEHICVGDSSDVWVAIMGGGLGHIYTDSGKMEVFTTSNGLVNNTVLNILKDKKGNLWISTNKGISMFNPHTRQFRNFEKADGMLIEEFNSDANYLASDGEMFFGGVGGVLSFYPDSVQKYDSIGNSGQLLITDFKVSGISRYFEKPIYELNEVALKKGDNNFQLTFARLDFNHSDQIKYRYRMSAQNSTWTETDHRQRNINYANLGPGKYKLEIEATNSSGEWDGAISLIVFIPPFYYQSLWFKILIFMILVTLIAFAFVIYTRQIRLTAKQKQDELRLESLRGQMNPHFIFNALNSINYFISNSDKISANSYIADFSRLIRNFLNNLSHEYIPFEKELESIQDYLKLEHLRFNDKFDYELKLEMENHSQISVFPGLVQPFIENAIWHGVRGLDDRKGKIKVSFKRLDTNLIRCTVEDDGIGRKQAEIQKNILPEKKSRGIGIVTERLKIISEISKFQYALLIEDVDPRKKEAGTRAIIDLPIKLSFDQK